MRSLLWHDYFASCRAGILPHFHGKIKWSWKNEFSVGPPVGSTCSDSAASGETTDRPDQHPQPDPNQQQVLRRDSGKPPPLLLVSTRLKMLRKNIFSSGSWSTWALRSLSGVQKTGVRTWLLSSTSPFDHHLCSVSAKIPLTMMFIQRFYQISL